MLRQRHPCHQSKRYRQFQRFPLRQSCYFQLFHLKLELLLLFRFHRLHRRHHQFQFQNRLFVERRRFHQKLQKHQVRLLLRSQLGLHTSRKSNHQFHPNHHHHHL
jgi:hypothetical protein